MKWLFFLSSLMVQIANHGSVLGGQRGGRRESVIAGDISNEVTGERILFRKQRGVVTGIIAAVAIATSTTSAVLHSLDCKDLDSEYNHELENTNKVVADYNFEVRKWKLTAKEVEDTYATTKYIQDRVEWIWQMEEDIEKDVLSIINVVLVKKLDPGNLDVIDDWKPQESFAKDLTRYVMSVGTIGNVLRLSHQLRHRLKKLMKYGRYVKPKTLFGTAFRPQLTKFGLNAFTVAGVGYDIYAIVDKFERCKKSKLELRRKRAEYEEGIHKMGVSISKNIFDVLLDKQSVSPHRKEVLFSVFLFLFQ